MSLARVTRPAADSTPEQIAAYYTSMKAAMEKAGIDYGDEFVICPVSTLQGKLYNVDEPGEDALGAFSGSAPDTSRQAAVANYPRSGTQREEILGLVVVRGTMGATRDELVEMTQRPPNVVTPRVKELVEGGWLEETDRRRKTRAQQDAVVLVASQKTLQERSGEP